MSEDLEIVFESDELIAINKPHGLLVHRSKIAKDATEFALQKLRDQIQQKVYPAHRLDRKTSGVLLFGKSKEAESKVQELFRDRKMSKVYRAIVRGFIEERGTIDYAIGENDKKLEAITNFECIEQFEIPLPYGKFQTSRYSYIEIVPETGRFHQIRKHMAHIFHPIIGDRPHGCNKQNKLWKEKFNMDTMMLHASLLSFENDYFGKVLIKADLSSEFKRVLELLTDKKIRR